MVQAFNSLQRYERARELDHLADRHLAENRHEVAEKLSHAAAELRSRCANDLRIEALA